MHMLQLSSRTSKDLILISAIYTIAHGLILFNNGLYWDDWTFFFMDKQSLSDVFSQRGTLLGANLGNAFAFLFSLPNSIFIIRVCVFAAFLLAALLLYFILTTVKEIDPVSRFFLVTIFAIFPVNSARNALVCLPYAIGYCFFFLGLWLTSRYLVKKALYLRLLALVGFFLSFEVQSLLFFYLLVLLYIVYEENCLQRFPPEIRKTAAIILRYIDFVILPVFFWVLRYIFFPPRGAFAVYYNITLSTLTRVPANLLYTYYTSFAQVLAKSIGLLRIGLLRSTTAPTVLAAAILAVLGLIALYLIANALSLPHLSSIFRISRTHLKVISNNLTQWYRPAETQKERDALKLFIVGLVFFGVGVFPYLLPSAKCLS